MMAEIKHFYGNQVHIQDSQYASSLLTRACKPQTTQPEMTSLIGKLYSQLLQNVLDNEFPTVKEKTPTRMTAKHNSVELEATVLDPSQRVAVVALARAGTWPSQVCYDILNHILNPELIRQDHIIAARDTDKSGKVVGTSLFGSKIGGDVDKSIVLFPDPMAATGSTIAKVIEHYKKNVPGRCLRFVAMHLILTPEYLSKITKEHPDVSVYAYRIDRGLSPADVLKETPGKRWKEEIGLDANSYIVPGAGGIGEILNNSFV